MDLFDYVLLIIRDRVNLCQVINIDNDIIHLFNFDTNNKIEYQLPIKDHCLYTDLNIIEWVIKEKLSLLKDDEKNELFFHLKAVKEKIRIQPKGDEFVLVYSTDYDYTPLSLIKILSGPKYKGWKFIEIMYLFDYPKGNTIKHYDCVHFDSADKIKQWIDINIDHK